MTNERAFLNGINGATGEYFVPPLTKEQFVSRALARPAAGDTKFQRSGTNLERLDQAGWAVVFPPGDIFEFREALQPLLDHRRSLARGFYKEIQLEKKETVDAFLRRHEIGGFNLDPEKVPYFLLLVGSPEIISFEFQYLLDVNFAVGRIAFGNIEEYRRYAETVVSAERREIFRRKTVALFGVQNDDDPLTELSVRELVNPLAAEIEDRKGEGWQLESVLRRDANKAELSRLILDGEKSLVFTASHALAYHSDDPALFTDQGAILCSDWPGPASWQGRIPESHFFSARDLPETESVAGLITFHFACYSAGTPELDDFAPPGTSDKNRVLAPRPFLSALSQRLLSHPQGSALAVIGHVDKAWPHSFRWGEVGSQVEVFASTLLDLLKGKPVGLAMDYFGQKHAIIASRIVARLLDARLNNPMPDSASNILGAFLWVAQKDARSYIILGDPAVRLATDRNVTEERPQEL